MKTFKIFFEFYPFRVGARPEREEPISANTIDEAIQKFKDEHGDSVEVFEKKTRDSN